MAAAVLAMVLTAPSAFGEPPRDTYFQVKTTSSGDFMVDYHNDGDFRDGQYRFTWNWATKHIVRFSRGRLTRGSALGSMIRFRTFEGSNLTVRFSADPPGTPRRDDSDCAGGPFRYRTGDGRVVDNSPTSKSPASFAGHEGSWRMGIVDAEETPSVLIDGPPEPRRLAGCNAGTAQHAPASSAMHGLEGFPDLKFEVPRGAFNPASDRKYRQKQSFSANQVYGDGHDADGAYLDDAPHGVLGASTTTITFKALTESTALKRARDFRGRPPVRYE